MFGFNRGVGGRMPTFLAIVTFAVPEAFFALFECEAIKPQLRDLHHGVEDIVHRARIRQAKGIEIVEKLPRFRRLCARLRVLDRISAVIGIEPDIGENLYFQLMRKPDEAVHERIFEIRMGITNRKPAPVLRVPDLDGHIAKYGLVVIWQVKWPVAIHHKVKLIDLIVQANV
ncbi:hypothetical protein SDC9_147736 [bioreactor metagenome]|uniref:Uncharacterized protein n=1 Tax=bioreactor metagenome TaxID=1076179 RepID=A0A645EF71_9ZZZZ